VFRTTLCGPELQLAHESGEIKAVHAWAEYKLTPCLQAFMRWSNEHKRQSQAHDHDGFAAWAKGIGVALVGKLAARERTWQEMPEDTSGREWGESYDIDKNGIVTRYRWVAGLCQKEVVGGWASESVPAVAAFITSHGRVQLLRSIECAKRRNCYYCDTDSLLVSREGYERLQDAGLLASDTLGKLRLLSVSDDAEVCGIKHYRMGGTIKCSGIPKGLHHLNGAIGTSYLYSSTSAFIKAGECPIAERHKHQYARTMPYRQGIVTYSGIVEPFTVMQTCHEQTATTNGQGAAAHCVNGITKT
jgi:hypothetical protein